MSKDVDDKSKKKEDLLENLITFLKYDYEIKKIMFNCAPNEIDKYNDDYVFRYSNKLFSSLKEIKDCFKIMFSRFPLGSFENIDSKFIEYENQLSECKNNYEKMKIFYENCISDMDIDFINKCATNCVGYSLFYGFDFVEESKTINELLHGFHSMVLNNSFFLEELPIIDKRKEENSNKEIVLYGKKSDIAKELFDSISFDSVQSISNIISINERKVILMFRDLGHALSMEIDINGDKCFVNYFIPKNCNYLMINNLKGVNKINEDSKYAVGCFEVEKKDLFDELNKFLSKVPTDMDMFEIEEIYSGFSR